MRAFQPAWWLRNRHAQTIWGRLARPRRLVRLRREILATPDGDEIVLDHLENGLTVDGSRFTEPHREPSTVNRQPSTPLHFVLMHGLEGSSSSVYMQGLLAAVRREGHGATAINFRSCARDPRRVGRELPNRRPRFYHSGETGDFDFVVRELASRHPAARLVAFGASIGGNVLLKWLGEHPGETLIAAAATLSTPYDLGAASTHLTTGLGPFYVGSFLRTLRRKVTRIAAEHPGAPVDVAAAMRARSFREFDDAVVAPLHGFRDADDYYTRSSSIHYLGRITAPTLCVSAVDDPFLPPEVLERARAAASPSVELLTTDYGGHVGFIAGSAPWRCVYWAEELIVRWLIDAAAARGAA